MRIIAGLEQPDSGTLQLAGTDALQLPAHRRPVNTVFQSYALFPHLNVRENVAFGGAATDFLLRAGGNAFRAQHLYAGADAGELKPGDSIAADRPPARSSPWKTESLRGRTSLSEQPAT